VKRLTTPEEMNLIRRLHPTGNHFVSLPVINASDGSIDRVGVLHMGAAGLIEFAGRQAAYGAETLPPVKPLLTPFLLLDNEGHRAPPGPAWRRRWDWVPTFEWICPDSGLGLRGIIFAPLRREGGRVKSHKGFVYVLEAVRAGEESAGGPAAVSAAPQGVGLDLVWADLIQTVYTSRPLPAELTVRRDRWTGGPVLEPRSGAGAGPAALAVAFSAPPGSVEWEVRHGAER